MTRQSSGSRPESQSIEPRRRNPLTQQDNWLTLSPFGMMRRFADEMDRMSEGFSSSGGRMYLPEVDIVERDGKLIVRADLPGMTRDDVTVDITENTVVIEGERKYEHEANESGIYRTERSYGRFRREIPLPEGVQTENATAKFKDGVLEVAVDASQMTKNRRRIQIQEESAGKPGKSAA
jgi:HSP20 family protein